MLVLHFKALIDAIHSQPEFAFFFLVAVQVDHMRPVAHQNMPVVRPDLSHIAARVLIGKLHLTIGKNFQ